MPKIQAEALRVLGRALLVANGVPEEEAATVARHVVNANLAGHDSHGMIMLPNYIERVKAGHIVPGAPFTIVQESPTTTVVDGNWGFGYVINERAMALTIEKAGKNNIAATTVFRQGHVGRLASYPLMAAKAGMIGMAWADSGRSPKGVAPFGGREARLGTNPWAIAVPSDLDGPFCMDFATSAVAMGKIKLAEARGQEIPLGWVVDKDGDLTTDPAGIKGGALLPLGGTEGYKGTALAAMGEIFCGILTGLGFGVEPTGRHNDGCFLIAIKVEAFRPLLTFRKEVADFAHYLKDTPPAKGSQGVLYPGEVEHRAEQARSSAGIEVEDATWQKLGALAAAGGVAMPE
ncbi:Ldh family oxidoreductase [Belnapia sp. T6]|uniref:Ldh family oxidoreductase n=1 Tax=Belnapia mucosa TaxID=2804532 RepID=A0ABS1VDD3_9PROT|nr:Ldh family oxidoreductase [Belnapia mucosa]MBL6459292.1 Ldh family oxidoreductase [Belnapia mucosa]